MTEKKRGRNIVGVVCMGIRWKQEVLVFIPEDPNDTVCADSFIRFPALVRSVLKDDKEVHFDFDTVPKEVYAYDKLLVEGCKPLTKSQKQNFLDQYFR